MRNKKRLWGWMVSGLLILTVPPLTLLLYKPSRVIVPQLNGMICSDPNLCVEKAEDRAKAIALIQASQEIVSESVGHLKGHLQYIFCSAETYFKAFGFGEAKAHAVEGVNAIVVGPRGWAKHIVAYDLSNDPRQPLSEPFESYRQRFRQWRQAYDSKNWMQQLKLEL